jgi:hypothetical protein
MVRDLSLMFLSCYTPVTCFIGNNAQCDIADKAYFFRKKSVRYLKKSGDLFLMFLSCYTPVTSFFGNKHSAISQIKYTFLEKSVRYFR